MTKTINFNIAEWYVIVSFSLMMGTACTGICFMLIGDPIFDRADWIGLAVLIGVCALAIISISQDHIHRR